MKPIRRTQVITLMAACAISTVFGQPTKLDMDALRAQTEAMKGQMDAQKSQLKDILKDAWKVQIDDSVRNTVKQFENWNFDFDSAAVEQAQRMSEDIARSAKDWIAFDTHAAIAQAQMQLEMAQDLAPKPATAPMAPMAPMPPMAKGFNFNYDAGGSYESGKSQLNSQHYEKAVEAFDRVINARNASPRADGAYYWKAYALNKLGKRDEALTTLSELTGKFPQSGWVSDAKALQVEVQQAKGQPVSPENQSDEDLKLYAINALMQSDSDRAVPLLEGLLNNPKMSPKLKERAIFVLAQSGSDKAHEIVGRYAKGASNPDLQLTAVEYLGSFRSKESRQLLGEVYASTRDVTVKRAVLRSFERSRDVDHLSSAAKSEQNVDLRYEAIRGLGMVHDDTAIAVLVSVYGNETDKNIKGEILRTLGNAGAVKQLIECARKESDGELKRVAVQRLGQMKSKEALDYIAELLK